MQINEKNFNDPVATLMAETDGLGYDAVILAVGNARAVEQGQQLLRAKGRLVIFSAVHGKTPVDLFDVHFRNLEIVGACNDQNRLDEAIEKLSDSSLELDSLITHSFAIDRYEEALTLAEKGHDRSMKVVLTFEDEA